MTDTTSSATLLKWAAGLMRGHKVTGTEAPLMAQHLRELCAIPGIRAALLQAGAQVVTPAHCRHVRINLQLAALRQTWSAGASEGETGREAVARKRAAVVEAEAAVSKCAAQLAADDSAVSAAQEQLSSARKRRLLVEAVGAQLVADTKTCRQHEQAVQAALLQCAVPPAAQQDEVTAVEAGVATVEELRQLLLHQQEGDLHSSKVAVWRRLSEEGVSGSRVVAGLTRLARDQTAQLQQTTAQLDLRADAAKLRLELTAGGSLSDLEQPAGVLCSLRELLCQMCGAHVEAAMQATRLAAVATSHAAARDAITNTLQLAIKHKHDGSGVSKLVQQSIAAAGQRAALQAMQQLAARLQHAAALAARERAVLRRTHAAILAFEATVESNLHRLKCLSHSVDVGWSTVSRHRDATRAAATATLSQLQLPSPALPLQLLCDELHSLSALPLAALTSLAVPGRGRVQERLLSISAADTDFRLVSVLDKVLGVASSALTAECVCDTVCATHAHLNALSARAEHAAQTSTALRSNTARALTTESIKELCRSVDASDCSLEEGVSSVLDTYCSQLQQARDALPVTRAALETWWSQPAKAIAL